MATLDIEFRTKGFTTGERQIAGMSKSLDKLESSISGVNFDSLTKHLQNVGIALSSATIGAKGLASALAKASKDAGTGGFTALKVASESYRSELAKLKLENQQLKNDLQKNNEAIADAKLAYEQGRSSQQSYRAEAARLRAEIEALRLKQAQNRTQTIATTGSYKEAQQKLTALGNTIRNTAGGFTNMTPALRAQITEYRRLNDQLKAFDGSMGNYQRNVGNYSSAILGSIPIIGQFTSVVGVAALAFQGLQKSFNTNLKLDALEYSIKQVSGNTTKFNLNMEYLRKTADRLGLDFVSTAQSFKQWDGAAKYSNLTAEQSRKIFESVANAGAKMKLSNEQVQGTFLALSQMMSKGKVQAEELRGQLGERLPGAFALAAQAMGVTEQKLGDMMKAGELVADDFLPKFADQLDKSFGNNQKERIESLQASVNRLGTEFDLLFRSDRATSFFKGITDGLATMTSDFNKAINSKSFQEFFIRISGVAGASAIGDAFKETMDFKALSDVNRATYGYAQKEADERVRMLKAQKEILNLRVKEYNINQSSKNKEELIQASAVYAEMIKINSELGLYSTKKKAIIEDDKKTSKDQQDIERRTQTIRNDGLNYYDKKIAEIIQKYAELTKGISGATLEQAKLNEQAEKLKVWVELFTDVSKEMRKQSFEPTFNPQIPASIGDKMSQSAKDYNVRFFKNANAKFKKDQEDKDADRLQNRLSKVVESGFRQGIGSVLGDINNLGSNFYDVFSNVFKKLSGSMNKMFEDVLATQLGNNLSKKINDDKFSFAGLSKEVSKGVITGLGIVGGMVSGMSSKTSEAGQALGGALSGAAAGASLGPIGAAAGAVIGGVAGLFSAKNAQKQEKLQEQQILEQKRTNMLLERQQALAFTSSITGQATNQGIVTGVERNEFGDIVFEIEGRKLKTVIDRENAAQLKGV